MRKLCLMAVTGLLAVAGCDSGGSGNDGVLPGVKAMLLVKRAFITENGEHNVAGGANQVIDYLRYEPGGGVYVLEPPTPSGKLRSLTDDFEGVDIAGVDVSFDASEVLFSMRHANDDGRYHIYVTNADGSGDVRQLTMGPYDDVRPMFVPGGRIAFVTNQPYTAMGTRADEYNHSRIVTQIATISRMSGDADRHLCSQNLSHTADPFLMSDGSIGFSRWEHLGPVNDLKLFRMNPDCTQMTALAGQHDKPFNSFVQVHEASPGVFVGIATTRERTIQSGAVMQVDVRAETGTAGIAFDEQHARFNSLTPDVPTGMGSVASGVGRYRTPMALSDDTRYLVSWADGDVNDRNELANTAPNFGIYLYDPKSQTRTLIYDDPNTWDLYAMPLASRAEPPIRASVVTRAPDPSDPTFGTEPAVIGSIDVRQTSLTSPEDNVEGGQFNRTPLADALREATHVRIIEGFSSEIGSVREFGLTMHEGAAILGEVPVQADGSWEAKVVPYLPYHLQPIDKFGMSIRNQMLWIQGMPGETRRCGGCHESRVGTAITNNAPTTLAQQAPMDLSRIAIADRQERPWFAATSGDNVQDIFNRSCVSCHDGGANDPYAGDSYTITVPAESPTGMATTYEIPYLLLSDAPVETYYEMEVVTYPASYVSLLYPSAMMGEAMVEQGDVMPPEWVVPGAARLSRMIEKLNVQAPDGTLAWSGAPTHPEDVGGTLSAEDRARLIQMADLGGQYYSRRNAPNSTLLGVQY